MTRGHVDVALLRFLRTRGDETVVLNAAGDPAAAEPDLAGALLVAARALVGDGAQDTVSYSRIAQSPAFARYRHLAAGLRGLDPATFEERRPRTAFWINLYNALVIDAVITFGVCRSIRESPGFFQRAAYQVGPYRLGLDEIEHGVLRGNKPLFARLPPPFAAGDPRAVLRLERLDPRIHFALNCATRSCPPVAFYDAARLDAQLDAAAAAFINTEGLHVEDDAVVLSPLFSFYQEDFGGEAGVRDWLLRYLVDPPLRARVARAPLDSSQYDWALNGGTQHGDDLPANP